MHLSGLLVVVTILIALSFDFINGFHDAANSIATVVSTRVLTPGIYNKSTRLRTRILGHRLQHLVRPRSLGDRANEP